MFTQAIERRLPLSYNPSMIYEFDDSINFLKSTLEQKSRVNKNYSLRAFAEKLCLSPASLSLILNKKRKLSVERAHEVAHALDLSHSETEYFIALIQLEGSKSPTLKMQLLERIKDLNPTLKASTDFKTTLLGLDHFKLISDWYGLAILELITGVKGKWDAPAIARKLGLSKIEVDLMLERLINLELIELDSRKGHYKRCADTLMIESQVANEALRKYYEGIHDKSRASVRSQVPAEKVIGAQVFAFDPTDIEGVRKLTNDYLDSLNELALKGKNKTELYQAITNVFKLSKESL